MKFSNDPKRDLRRTFRKPPIGRVRKGSLLVLLRSDLQRLYGPEAALGGSVPTPLLAALGIFAGLELLAKYWSGKADTKQEDVVAFLTTVAGLSEDDAEVLLQFRNSLAHGYGLATRRRKDQRLFAFSLDTDFTPGAALLVPAGPDAYVVNLWSLKKLFVAAIRTARNAIVKDWMRLGSFQVCIRNLREVAVAG
jgi:hypothetical protein